MQPYFTSYICGNDNTADDENYTFGGDQAGLGAAPAVCPIQDAVFVDHPNVNVTTNTTTGGTDTTLTLTNQTSGTLVITITQGVAAVFANTTDLGFCDTGSNPLFNLTWGSLTSAMSFRGRTIRFRYQ